MPHSYPWSSRVWSSRAHCRGPHLIELGASSSSFFVIPFCYIFWPDCHCSSLCSTFISWGAVVLPFPLCHWSYSASCPSFITSWGFASHLWLGIRSGNCVAIVAFFLVGLNLLYTRPFWAYKGCTYLVLNESGYKLVHQGKMQKVYIFFVHLLYTGNAWAVW